MRRRMTERVRLVLAMLLVGSLLAMFASALPVVADDPPNPMRVLPTAPVAPGEEFEVTVAFTAPADGFSGIWLSERAPVGWTVSVDADWCDPEPDLADTPEPNQADYLWGTFDTYDEGTAFSGVYRVVVPLDAEPGEYLFVCDAFEYSIGADGPHTAAMGGQQTITVASPTGEVGLRARTPQATGCMKLVKRFEKPAEVEFPDDEIEVRVTGPDDFDEIYTLARADGWEKIIDGMAPGIYRVQEADASPPWIPSYDPEDRQLTVVAGDEPGEEAVMIITNIYSVIGISVSPSEIDFDEITPGDSKAGDTITVTNTGTLNIDVDAVLTADTPYATGGDLYFYTTALKLNDVFSDRHDNPTELGAWAVADLGLFDVPPAETSEVTTALVCPAEMYADTEYTGTLVFWAVATEP